MTVLLVTSWGQPACGIQAHSELLIEAVQRADQTIEMRPRADALDPAAVVPTRDLDLVHLNYHRALHSRWTVEAVRRVKAQGVPVVITFHDTFGEHPPDDLTRDLCNLAEAFIVHEPCEGLPTAIYLRQGVPLPTDQIGQTHPANNSRPILGTVGFDFPWKNYDRLCEIAAAAGWGVLIYGPAMSIEREAALRQLNPWLEVRCGYSTAQIVAGLRTCGATAFLYVCGNSGTSAAIRLGIAAGQPVIAIESCRQFRDLLADPLANRTVQWVASMEEAEMRLTTLSLGRFDPGIVALARQDSWEALGQRYAAIYRAVLA